MHSKGLFFVRFLSGFLLWVSLSGGVFAEDMPVAEAPTPAAEEGSPEFDLSYGIEAYENGHYYEAMFALERVVYAEPENMRARYVLAKTYYQLGDFSSAQREFKLVQTRNPPAEIAQDINDYLTRMDGGKKQAASLLGYAEAYAGHDNNINRGTTDNVNKLPSLPASPLYPEARQQSDMYRTLGAGFQYFYPVKNNFGVITKGNVTQKDFFSSDRFDEHIYNLSAAVNKKSGKNVFKLGASGQNYRLSDSSYSNIKGLEGGWMRELGKGFGLSAGVGFNEIRYPGNGLLNVDQSVLSLAINRHLDKVYDALGVMTTNESAKHSAGDHNARDSLFVFYDFNYYHDVRNTIQARVIYSKSQRDEMDPAFLVNRHDNSLGASVAWQWRYDDHLLVNTRLGSNDADSDISIYEYERMYLETGIRYSF